jgi:hypothetical protein
VRSVTSMIEDPKMIPVVIDTMEAWLSGEPVWPYSRIIEVWGKDFECWYTGRWSLSFAMDIYYTRQEWIRRFGFAIPCAELLDELAHYSHVVDVGAGSGYMTKLMRLRGINAVGSDFDVRGQSQYSFRIADHDPDQVTGTEAKTMARRFPDATIFCSWPSYDETWFLQLLRAMRVGQRLVVIRESACASDDAWEYLDKCFVKERTIALPVFPLIRDFAGVYLKKRNR